MWINIKNGFYFLDKTFYSLNRRNTLNKELDPHFSIPTLTSEKMKLLIKSLASGELMAFLDLVFTFLK